VISTTKHIKFDDEWIIKKQFNLYRNHSF
jgi:hypothetical protein